MKAAEIQIGDWVHYVMYPLGKDNPPYEEDVQIKNIYGDAINCITRVHEIISGLYLSDCKPIPLTPEILEKNGFVKVNTQRYDWGNPNDWYVNINPKKKIIHINGANGSNANLYYGVIGFYVHILQHALRLCGLDELADNFKVI